MHLTTSDAQALADSASGTLQASILDQPDQSANALAERMAQRCDKPHKTADGWQVCCPAHEDTDPSLSITPTGDTVLLHCFAGCPTDAILAALGMEWEAIFLASPHPARNGYRPKRATPPAVHIEPIAEPMTTQETALYLLLQDRCTNVGFLKDNPGPQACLRDAGHDPVQKAWVNQQLKRHGLHPPDIWKIVAAPAPAASGDSLPAPRETPRFQTISARELFYKELPPQEWIIPDILPVGATLFTGRGKDGKSLMVWNLCLAVATGGTALSQYDVTAGDVLYICLEDGERRAQKRLKDQMQHAGMEKPPERLDLTLWDAPRIGDGFETALTLWLDEHPAARLVVIDILEKVRPKRQRNGSVYADDDAAIAPLQRLAQERGIAMLIVHHSNKTRPDDCRDTASGSMGLIGACDTFWSLQRIAGEADAALRIIGRDVEGQELALQCKDAFWSVLGNAEEYRMSQVCKAVMEVLRNAEKPSTPAELAKELDISRDTMKKRLLRMAERGEILNIGDGRYIPRPLPPPILPTNDGERVMSPVSPVSPVITGSGDRRGQSGDTPPVHDLRPYPVNGLDIAGTPGTPGTPVDALFLDGQAQPSTQVPVNGTVHPGLRVACPRCGCGRVETRGAVRLCLNVSCAHWWEWSKQR